MPEEPPARRPRAAAIIGMVIGALFVAVGVAAFFAGGGPIVALIAAVGGALTLAAAIFVLARP